MKLKTTYTKLNADLHTPVSLYLRLRDRYAAPLLMESSDHSGEKGAMSVICLQPLSSFCLQNGQIKISETNSEQQEPYKDFDSLMRDFRTYRAKFETTHLPLKGPYAGFFGFTTHTASLLKYALADNGNEDIPVMYYAFYSIVLLFDHHKSELYCVSHGLTEEAAEQTLSKLCNEISTAQLPHYRFSNNSALISDCSDEDFLSIAQKGIQHCKRGDVFQVVLSRRFQTSFTGDEFEVYRALRNINPSPYLFYFDFENFRIFGSSPEAQMIVKNNHAEIHPIAGTIKRSGDDLTDIALARKLAADEKENAEHIMLVDLARNDLSIHCTEVGVKKLKEIQFFSHVIHLVSVVSGKIKAGTDSFAVMMDSFPAGTLSGAPKKRALQIIEETEKSERGYYGGTVGFIGTDESLNHAIVIRSFLSTGNTLTLRAGAGVVAASSPQGELEEINNKLGALKSALQVASTKEGKSKSTQEKTLATH